MRGVIWLILATVAVLFGDLAMAQDSTTNTNCDTFGNPIGTFMDVLTGPVAMGISMAAIIATGVTLAFGGEMKDFVKALVSVVFVIALIVGASGLAKTLFGLDFEGGGADDENATGSSFCVKTWETPPSASTAPASS